MKFTVVVILFFLSLLLISPILVEKKPKLKIENQEFSKRYLKFDCSPQFFSITSHEGVNNILHGKELPKKGVNFSIISKPEFIGKDVRFGRKDDEIIVFNISLHYERAPADIFGASYDYYLMEIKNNKYWIDKNNLLLISEY